MKLLDIINEDFGGGKFKLPKNHAPFMKSKEGFSCSKCKFYSLQEGKHLCSNKNFIEWSGSNVLKIDNPDEWCSDWFEPKK